MLVERLVVGQVIAERDRQLLAGLAHRVAMQGHAAAVRPDALPLPGFQSLAAWLRPVVPPPIAVMPSRSDGSVPARPVPPR